MGPSRIYFILVVRRSKFDIKEIKDRLFARLFERYPILFRKWLREADIIQFDYSPWAELTSEISQARVALVTTGGVHLKSQIPFDMNDSSGDPTFREIPADVTPHDLTITHNYYNHRDADKDVNIVLPIENIKQLENTGEIGSVNKRHFSFMGHITGPYIETLINETALQVVKALNSDNVDIVILTPA